MSPISRTLLFALLFVTLAAGCTGPLAPTAAPTVTAAATAAATATVTATATATATASPTATATPVPTATNPPTITPLPTRTRLPILPGGARACAFIPGVSVPAVLPAEILNAATPTPYPTPEPPANHAVSPEVTDQQLAVFHEIVDYVNQYYVYRDFNGRDWPAMVKQYEALVRGGLEQADFYYAMNLMIYSLGDNHSSLYTPEQLQKSDEAMQGKEDFVGVGAYAYEYAVPGQRVIMSVLPGSPAEEAGLLPHDIILAVDGGPVEDENGLARTLGPEGTPVTITIQTPGEPPRDLTLIRRRITSQPRLDFCLVPGTRIGYIRWENFQDATTVDQMTAALQALNAGGPLKGLILDNRTNFGGSVQVMEDHLALFTSGKMGDVVSGQEHEPIAFTGKDVMGSQRVPLVVLVGPDTASAGEWSSGLLQLIRGAKLVGQRTSGNVEELYGFDLQDGSRLYLAVATLQPKGLKNGAWEGAGLVPDYEVPERWDLFSEATDPAIAKAVEVLSGR